MRFALVGDHPDGLDMARALVDSGRHELVVYAGGGLGLERLSRWGMNPTRVGDVEELLANPAIEMVIVAGSPSHRGQQLRRALQSEHHVLCVLPIDSDLAYEATMLQADTRTILLPLSPEVLHPAFGRLAEIIRDAPGSDGPPRESAITEHPGSAPASLPNPRPRRPFDLLDMELSVTEAIASEEDIDLMALPGWNVMRFLGGEIIEVVSLAETEEIVADDILLVSGRFENGGLFRSCFLPHQAESRWRWTARKGYRRFELLFEQGWPGPARLTYTNEHGQGHEENWDTWNPWPAMVERFEDALGRWAASAIVDQARHGPVHRRAASISPLQWQDAIRSLELDDAARRSVERRRASTLDFQEVSEEVGFKGTMTLVGCSLIWLCLALLILSIWISWVGWLIAPVLGIFLFLQLFRWIIPGNRTATSMEVEPRVSRPGSSKDVR